jgi:cytochrome b561
MAHCDDWSPSHDALPQRRRQLWPRHQGAALDDDLLLGAHIATHLTLFVALVVHVGLVLKHQFVDRDRLLNRMR